jgi:lipopolysaccharide biosynthesis protein
VIQSPRTVAFYLPQFHPIPENDRWWGKGFTEWTNVTAAQPLFKDHYQPHLPTDLGFYDLRLRETRHEQIRMAREHGIDAFCYHYYWFSGTRILYQPLDDMLADAASDMPFCLCWANENWTRRWDAAEHEVLIAQRYLPEDDVEFIRSVEHVLTDRRYLRVADAPILVVYRPQQLPDARRATATWREYWRTRGHGALHLCAALTHGNENYIQFGFDSGVEFPPHNLQTGNVNPEVAFFKSFKGNVMQLPAIARDYLNRRHNGTNVFRCVCPSWDNTARLRERALVMLNGTPANYEYWLSEAIRRTRIDYPVEERLVFVNAWNEWAEGCHLEPDRRYQRGFLEATRRAVRGECVLNDFVDEDLPKPGDNQRRFAAELRDLLEYHYWLQVGRMRLWINRHPVLKDAFRPLFRLLRLLRQLGRARSKS